MKWVVGPCCASSERLQENRNLGRRDEWRDAYGLEPTRARVAAGSPVTWTNTTTLPHLVAARARCCTGPGVPDPSRRATPHRVVIDRPGTYEYVCHEHLWTPAWDS